MDWKVLFGTCAFLAFLGWDILRACRRGDLLIQGQALVLSGLTVQLLGYFDIQNVNVFVQNHEHELQMLFNKQISTDVSRLIFCIFIGYVLPGVALAQSRGRWMNIAALVLSFVFHTVTEVYVLQNVKNPSIRNQGGGLFIFSTVLLSAATICLMLCLGFSILHGKFLRDKLLYNFPRLFAQSNQDNSMTLQRKMLDAWVVAYSSLEKNWLKMLAFAPVVASIVTTCVAVVGIKIGRQKFVWHSNVGFSFYLRCAFILLGWIIILWRSFLFSLYVASDQTTIKVGRCDSIHISYRLIYLHIRTALDPMPLYDALLSKGVPETVVQNVLMVLRILAFIFTLVLMLPFCLLLALFFILIGPLLLPLVFTSSFFAFLFHLKKFSFISTNEYSLAESGHRCTIRSQSLSETEDSMEKAEKNGQRSRELASVINRSALVHPATVVCELQHRQCWKMTAVAAIYILAELAERNDERVRRAIKAFKQAEDLLEALDCPDNMTVDFISLFETCRVQAYWLNLEAKSEMLKLENFHKIGKQRRPTSYEDVHTVVRWLGDTENTGNSQVVVGSDGDTENTGNSQVVVGSDVSFYQDWIRRKPCCVNDHMASEKLYSMECVCKAICRRGYNNEMQLSDEAYNCLGDIIGACLSLLPDVLLQHRGYWVRDFQEDKLRKAVEIAAKLSGVIEMLYREQSKDIEMQSGREMATRPTNSPDVFYLPSAGIALAA